MISLILIVLSLVIGHSRRAEAFGLAERYLFLKEYNIVIIDARGPKGDCSSRVG